MLGLGHRVIRSKIIVVLIVTSLVFVAGVHPSYAALSSLTFSNLSMGAALDCSAGGGGFSAAFTSDTYPGGASFTVTLLDGNGNAFGSGGGGGGGGGPAFSGSGGFGFSNPPTARPFTLIAYDGSNPIGSITFDPATLAAGCASLPYVVKSSIQPLFTDGRMNKNDAGQTGAVYCTDGGVMVLHPNGKLGLKITKAQLDIFRKSHPLTGSQNALIKVQDGFKLYLLSDGNLQLVGPSLDGPGGSNYMFVWGGC